MPRYICPPTTNPQIRSHPESWIHRWFQRTMRISGNSWCQRSRPAQHSTVKELSHSIQKTLGHYSIFWQLLNKFAREQQNFISPPHDANRIRVLSPRVHCSPWSRHTKHDVITSLNIHRNYSTFHGTSLTKCQSTEPIPATQCRTARSMRCKDHLYPTYRCNATSPQTHGEPSNHIPIQKPPNSSLNPAHHAYGWYKSMWLDNWLRLISSKTIHPWMVPLQFKPI